MGREKKKVRYKFQLTGPGLIMWGTGIFLLLVWSFILGILVGRGSIPDRLKYLTTLSQELGKLGQKAHKPGKAGMAKQQDDTSTQENLDFFQKLVEKNEERIPATTPENKDRLPRARRRTETGLRSSGGIRYTVQIASFDSKDKAAKLVQALVGKGMSAYYVIAETRKGRFYRVRCGNYASRKEAAAQLRTIKNATGLEGFVCRR